MLWDGTQGGVARTSMVAFALGFAMEELLQALGGP